MNFKLENIKYTFKMKLLYNISDKWHNTYNFCPNNEWHEMWIFYGHFYTPKYL